MEELFAYLEADGVEVKIRRYPSGDLLGYSRRPTRRHEGERRAGLPLRQEDRPRPVPAQPPSTPHHRGARGIPHRATRPARTRWQRATEALDTLHDHLTDDKHGGSDGRRGSRSTGHDARAQAQITALGEVIDATAQAAPAELRDQLRAASKEFARAQRSRIRADHQAAADLRARRTRHRPRRRQPRRRDLRRPAHHPGLVSDPGRPLAPSSWPPPTSRSRPRPPSSTSKPPTTGPPPRTSPRSSTAAHAEITHTLAGEVHTAIPDHADRILADPNWPALATVLADAQAGGHRSARSSPKPPPAANSPSPPPRQSPPRPHQHTTRNPAPNPRAEAARLRSHAARHPPPQPQSPQPVARG